MAYLDLVDGQLVNILWTRPFPENGVGLVQASKGYALLVCPAGRPSHSLQNLTLDDCMGQPADHLGLSVDETSSSMGWFEHPKNPCTRLHQDDGQKNKNTTPREGPGREGKIWRIGAECCLLCQAKHVPGQNVHAQRCSVPPLMLTLSNETLNYMCTHTLLLCYPFRHSDCLHIFSWDLLVFFLTRTSCSKGWS